MANCPVLTDVSCLLTDLPTCPVTRRRYNNPTINAFGETEQTHTDQTFEHPVHVVDMHELKRMGLDYTIETIRIYFGEELSYPGDTFRPDRWLFQGVWYEVAKTDDYLKVGCIASVVAQRIQKNAGDPS